tara:strand:+ start:2585 stop:3085 length:501 start_codon:yes stop_codon:yes gene_type:complete
MALLKILTFPDPRLRTVAEPIQSVDESIKKLADDMLETMYEGSGIGLAATQVNEHKRIFVIDISEDKTNPMVFINPHIVEVIDPTKKSYSEGCLSIPGFYEEVERPSKVKASFINLDGQKEYIELEDLMAVVVQHEIDHLDGKLMVDFISSVKREMIRKKLSKKRS